MGNTGDDRSQKLRALVDQAIRAATPADQMVEHKLLPTSTFSTWEPSPQAGLTAALAVIKAAEQKAHTYALGLRAEGVSWRELADLLELPWAEGFRAGQAYEAVLGPEPAGSSSFHDRCLYWRCGGPAGCGQYITDHGPYDGHPRDCESGHADGCLRLATEVETYLRAQQERDQQDQVADTAMQELADDTFGKDVVGWARWVIAHDGRYGPWSTGETLAVALALHDDDMLKRQGYSDRRAAAARVFDGMDVPPADPGRWLATVHAAATGKRD